MTELSFLIELLLNHDLPKATKDLVATRIKDVEVNLTAPRIGNTRAPFAQVNMPIIPSPELPIEQIAQTPAAANALNHRADLINKAVSQKREMVDTGQGTKGPRKW